MADEKKNTEVAEVVNELATQVDVNLFGSGDGENFLMNTLGQNFKQVKETQIQYKVEDILSELDRRIQLNIRDLRRKQREPQDNLVKLIPTTAMMTLNLDALEPADFCDAMKKWGIELHNLAKETWIYLILRKSLFGMDWEKPEEVAFVKSKIIL